MAGTVRHGNPAVVPTPTAADHATTKDYVDDADALKQDLDEKGVANGYCELDSFTAVPTNRLRAASTSQPGVIKLAQDLGGTWDLPTVPGLASKLNASEKGAASGVGTLTSATRQTASEIPIVKHQIRTGSVTTSLTSDAASGTGNLVNLDVNGNATINAPTNPVDWQEFEHHLVAVSASRTVTFGGGYIQGGVSLGPYTVPRGAVLIAKSVYVGNRNNSSDVDAPAWALVSVAITDTVTAPAAHAASHADGGSDEISIDASQMTSGTLAIGRIPTGSTSSTVTIGNDSRLSDARTPTSHASSHYPGGSDPLLDIDSLSNVGNGGTISPDANAGNLTRVTTTGATATLAVPSNGADGSTLKVQITTSGSALALSLNASIVNCSGATAPIAVGSGKKCFLGLERVSTTWYLLAVSVEP